MARPSRNIDQRLLDAGRELLPQTGCAGLSARRLTEHAGVNLAMLNYHFGSKDAFIRRLLDGIYDEMFAELTVQASAQGTALERLRASLRVLARFVHRNRPVLARIMADALNAEPVALEFLAANVPRHVKLLVKLVREAQRARALVRLPVPQVLAFVFGGSLLPVLFGTAVQSSRAVPLVLRLALDLQVMPLRAIEKRIDLALRGLAVPGSTT